MLSRTLNHELYQWEYPVDFMEDLSVFWNTFLDICVVELFAVFFFGFILMMGRVLPEVELLGMLKFYMMILGATGIVFSGYYFIIYAKKYREKVMKRISVSDLGIRLTVSPKTELHAKEDSVTDYEHVTKLIFSNGQHKLIYYDSHIKKCWCYIPSEIYEDVTTTILNHCNSTMEVVFKE